MIVSLHTVADLLSLLIASFVSGICVYLLYIIIEEIPRSLSALTSAGFPKYKRFCCCLTQFVDSKHYRIFTDISVCVISAGFLLLSSFVYNTGALRASAILIFGLGFYICKLLLLRPFKALMSLALYICKWAIDIALYPLLLIFRALSAVIKKAARALLQKRKEKAIAKYTRTQFAELKEVAKHGFLNSYYRKYNHD